VSASISQLIPELQPFARDLVSAAGAAGLQPRITSTRRSGTEQARLYRRYLAGQNPFPVAPPGTSAHEFGYAFDMVVTPMDALADVGAYWKAQGGIWGGEFNDPVHFEYPGFSKPRSAPLEGTVVGNVVTNVTNFLDSIPWYISMWMPMAISTQQANEGYDEFAARVLKWTKQNFGWP
jgi:D-alanyl-D-alanine carboxypeptidase